MASLMKKRLLSKAASGPWAELPIPTEWTTIREAAGRTGGEFRVARPPEPAPWRDGLRYADGSRIPFQVPLLETLPETGVGVIPGAEVRGSQGAPMALGALLLDATFFRDYQEYADFSAGQRFKPIKRLRGTTLNLSSTYSLRNYGHALLDGICRLAVVKEAGIALAEVDHVLMPGMRAPTLLAIAKAAGVPEKKMVFAESGIHLGCDILMQPTFPGHPRQYSDAASLLMRAVGVTPAPGGPRRLMILREGEQRAVENAAEVKSLAGEFDLEVYDPRQSRFSPADFAAAELVVGAHGAALADLVFCQPGTRVLDLMSSIFRYPYYGTLATASGLAYRALDCTATGTDKNSDFTVDLAALREALASF